MDTTKNCPICTEFGEYMSYADGEPIEYCVGNLGCFECDCEYKHYIDAFDNTDLTSPWNKVENGEG